MAAETDRFEILASIPSLVSQSVHHILEGQRAAADANFGADADGAEAFLSIVRECRQKIESLREGDRVPAERLLSADYQLAEVERDISEAIERMNDSRTSA